MDMNPITESKISAKKNLSWTYEEAFKRNLGLVTPQEQHRLRKSRVAIAGMGGVGGIEAVTLARMGVGNFNIADPDYFEPANFNRQYGATQSNLYKSKAKVMAQMIKEINPEADVRIFTRPIDEKNVDQFLKDADLLVDGIDAFAIDARRLVHNKALKKGIYSISAGPFGFGTAWLIFNPQGRSFDEYFDIHDDQTLVQKWAAFFAGMVPQATHLSYTNIDYMNILEGSAPSLSLGCQLAAGVVGAESLKILLKRGKVKCAPTYHQFDDYKAKYIHRRLWFGNKNPIQKLKRRVLEKIIEENLNLKPRSSSPFLKEGIPFKELIDAAVKAPSPDNSQPWIFKPRENKLTIEQDEKRARHSLNYDNTASLIGLGGVIESISIAASHNKLKATIRLPDYALSKFPWAIMEFERSEIQADELYSAIDIRATDRRPFKKGKMSENIKKELLKDHLRFRGTGFHLKENISDTFHNLLLQTDRIMWEHKDVHRDIFSWVRFTIKEMKNSRDGMGLRSMGINFVQAPLFWLVKNFQIQKIFNPLFFLKAYQFHLSRLIRSSAGFGLVTVSTNTPEDLVQAGRLWYRLWCRLNLEGFGVQPLSSASLLIYSQQLRIFPNNMPKKFVEIYKKGYEMIKKEFNLDKNELPVMLFRTGPADPLPKSHRTLRRPLSHVIR